MDTVPVAITNMTTLVAVIGVGAYTLSGKSFLCKVNIVSYLLHLFPCVISTFSVGLRVPGLK